MYHHPNINSINYHQPIAHPIGSYQQSTTCLGFYAAEGYIAVSGYTEVVQELPYHPNLLEFGVATVHYGRKGVLPMCRHGAYDTVGDREGQPMEKAAILVPYRPEKGVQLGTVERSHYVFAFLPHRSDPHFRAG